MPPAGTCALTAAIMLQHSGRQNSSSWPALPGCTVWMCIHPSAHLPRRVATGRRATGRIRHAPEQRITTCCRPTSTAQRIVCSAVEHYIHCISHQPHLAHGVAPNWRIRTRSVGSGQAVHLDQQHMRHITLHHQQHRVDAASRALLRIPRRCERSLPSMHRAYGKGASLSIAVCCDTDTRPQLRVPLIESCGLVDRIHSPAQHSIQCTGAAVHHPPHEAAHFSCMR